MEIGPGDYAYVFGSTWADWATYDTVGENDDYMALQEQHQETYKSLVGDEIYNKYELVQ